MGCRHHLAVRLDGERVPLVLLVPNFQTAVRQNRVVVRRLEDTAEFKRRLVFRDDGLRDDGGDDDFAFADTRVDAQAAFSFRPRNQRLADGPSVHVVIADNGFSAGMEAISPEQLDAGRCPLVTNLNPNLVVVALRKRRNGRAFDPRVLAAVADGMQAFLRAFDLRHMVVATPSVRLAVAEIEQHDVTLRGNNRR